MFRLVARFDVTLQGNLLFKRSTTDDLCYETTIDDFGVELCLNPDVKRYQNMQKSGVAELSADDYYWATSKVRIHSTRNEDETPPASEIIDGRISYEERRVYFEERKPAYQQAAWEVLDRAVLFFKYKLHNPNLSIDDQYSQDFQNPVWLDDSGNAINNPAIYGVGTPLPLPIRFGVKPMSCYDDCDLEKALKNSFSPNMTEQLLSDAQSAVL